MADIKIRGAEESDLKHLYVMVKNLLEQSPEYSRRTPNPTKIVANLTRYIRDDNHCAFIACIGDFPIGLMLGYVYVPEMFDDQNAADTLLYVEPAWRSDGVGQELLETYASWAATKGAGGNIYFGTTTQLTKNATKRLIDKTDFKVVGQIARK